MVRNSKTDQTAASRMAHVQARRSEPVSFALTGNRGLRDPQVTRGFRLSAVALERLFQDLSLDLPERLPQIARFFRDRVSGSFRNRRVTVQIDRPDDISRGSDRETLDQVPQLPHI